jgi:hypothetical protein
VSAREVEACTLGAWFLFIGVDAFEWADNLPAGTLGEELLGAFRAGKLAKEKASVQHSHGVLCKREGIHRVLRSIGVFRGIIFWKILKDSSVSTKEVSTNSSSTNIRKSRVPTGTGVQQLRPVS